MAEKDALRDKNIPGSGGGLFTKLTEGNPIKLRVLTTDPMVTRDKWGNTRFAFVVWNYTEEKAQILNKGSSIASEIKRLHLDEDYGANIQEIGIKITTKGQLKDTRYSVDPLPNIEKLTKKQLEELKKVDLEKAVKNGVRLSELESEEDIPVNPNLEVERTEDVVIEDIDEEEVDLSEIPL